MQFWGKKKERERESERIWEEDNIEKEEKSDLIGSLSLEQPKVGYPDPPDK